MNVSWPSVHPVAVAPLPALEGAIAVPRIRMKDMQGMPATVGGLCLRISQFAFAVMSLSVMAATNDFPSVTAFVYLVAAMGIQSLWSLSLAVVDVYALLVRRSLQNAAVITFFTIGDGITSTVTFAAACASAGITILISNDFNKCAENHCTRFETATAMAFVSWFAASPSFLFNYWSLASR
uniref:CASP-like protein n=1 Tax=Kalanchoe fedtschenkoi TaxID=63787 RepID=A0A7N0R9A8_KALFE